MRRDLRQRPGVARASQLAVLVVALILALFAAYLVSQRSGVLSTTNTQTTLTVSNLGPHSIGYVGCSNTANAVAGYYLVANKGLFWQPYATGGGSLDLWANATSRYWTLFDQQVQRYGQPSVVWVEICERATAPITFAVVREVFTIMKQHAPSATFFISPLNSYSPSNICALTGPNGVADATDLANQAVSSGLASMGPVIGPLTAQNTQSDMCHPNMTGEVLLGGAACSFLRQVG